MSRKKFLEQTYNKIIEVSYNLFIQKGYEKTSVQDIINELGLSKGAIYHYFKSKEEILYAVLNKEKENADLYLEKIITEANGYTAKEKLKYILVQLTGNEDINIANKFLINQPNNSKAIIESIIQTVNEDSFKFYILIKEGIEDGSIKTDFPKECAELLLLLCNVWLNPILFNRTYEDTINRFKFIQFTMKQLGVDVIDNELLGKIENNLKGVGINEINE
jgi:TetR/AcrR family transcriptional repressor of nem operon